MLILLVLLLFMLSYRCWILILILNLIFTTSFELYLRFVFEILFTKRKKNQNRTFKKNKKMFALLANVQPILIRFVCIYFKLITCALCVSDNVVLFFPLICGWFTFVCMQLCFRECACVCNVNFLITNK